ncbi:hypothetical protein OAP75_03035, partial [Candidatus Pseudothioglobus singularis]|nr:hypothetical protein [Candidatus Pseudothioglobus singularis]
GLLNELGICSYCRPRISLKALKRRYSMGKVTYKELSKDHPIFKAGWIISSIKNQSDQIKIYEKRKLAEKEKLKK